MPPSSMYVVCTILVRQIMNASPRQNLGSMLPDASTYSPPEVKKGGFSSLKEYCTAYAFKCKGLTHLNTGYHLPLRTHTA